MSPAVSGSVRAPPRSPANFPLPEPVVLLPPAPIEAAPLVIDTIPHSAIAASGSTPTSASSPGRHRSLSASSLVSPLAASPVASAWHTERARRLTLARSSSMGSRLSRRSSAKAQKKAAAQQAEKLQANGKHAVTATARVVLPEPLDGSPMVDITSPVGLGRPVKLLSSSAPSSPLAASVGFPSSSQISAASAAYAASLAAAARSASPGHRSTRSFPAHPPLPASSLPPAALASPGSAHRPPHHPPAGRTSPAASPGHGHHHHHHHHAPLPTSPITSASPLARRIKSLMGHSPGGGRDFYALPPAATAAPATGTTAAASPALLSPATSSPSSSPADAAAVFPLSPVPLDLPTPALPANSAQGGASGEKEALLFSPAYVLPPADAPAAASHTPHPIVSVNAIPQTVLAQSTVVQSAVAAQGGSGVTERPASTATIRAEAAVASAAAVAAHGVSEAEFDPFRFIKNLPPLHQAVRTCRVPVLPPIQPSPAMEPRICLALDLDETLVHCSIEPLPRYDLTFRVLFSGAQYQVFVALRPHLFRFLAELVDAGFELVLFTASQRIYADRLLDLLDPPVRPGGSGKYFAHRLFRDSCCCVEGNFLKDLSVLGRDLRHTVIVDNSVQAFGYQLDNGIAIESWFDDEKDEELLKLLPFLKHLRGMPDVRPTIRSAFKLSEFVRNMH